MKDDPAFDDWKLRASQCDIVIAAERLGAKLKRVGRELAGPCPVCGGRDRFAVNPSKRIFICRGAAGGDVIGMTMHLCGLDFIGACEQLTGEPAPKGMSRTTDAQAKAEIERRREQAARERNQREKEEQADREKKAVSAGHIWESTAPLAETAGEAYLLKRGFYVPPSGWPPCLRFHKRLSYDLDTKLSFPCIVARVDDVAGDLTAVWREYITEDGLKAPVEVQKLGLGPTIGGAVRIGGLGPKIGAAEGFRSALGAWFLIGFRYPVWSLLATAGFDNVELPLEVKEVRIFPDGDKPVRRKDGEFIPVDVPPGRRAARKLRDRAKSMGIKATIEPEPLAGFDYENIFISARE